MDLDGLEQFSATEPSGKKCYGFMPTKTVVDKHGELLNPGKVAHTASVVAHMSAITVPERQRQKHLWGPLSSQLSRTPECQVQREILPQKIRCRVIEEYN